MRLNDLVTTALIICVSTGLPSAGLALEPDAPFEALQAQNAEEWRSADKQVDGRLDALHKRFGKRPNIVYILADDIGWGEVGWQGGGKHRGQPTPTLDRMAHEGMRFWSAYAEPSCTPSRVALMTGRHPVRTGLTSVLFPGISLGLSPEEVTVAELLSDSGYHTAMWGKWHLGELEKHAPENQGFDYAYYGLYNGSPDFWQSSFEDDQGGGPYPDFPGYDRYKELSGIDLSVAGYVGRKGKGRKPIEGPAGKLGPGRQEAFENEAIDQMTAWIRDKADSDQPFFVYWASYALQMGTSREFQDMPGVDRQNRQASLLVMHDHHVSELLQTLHDAGIAENTLVVWISDNGPMYGYWPTAGYSWLRGGKGEVTEGGVRVPAAAWWPGMIEPGQDPKDIVHLTDLFTTAARIGGALDAVPSDRITDGVDQTALLLLGEGNSRRNFMFHYSGDKLGAFRIGQFKVHFVEPKGGLPPLEIYNIERDPAERMGDLYAGLFAVAPVQLNIGRHRAKIARFPHRPPERPRPVSATKQQGP